MEKEEKKVEITDKEPIKKKQPIKLILIFILFIIVLFCDIRFWSHNIITIKEYPIILEKLPSNFNGLKIVQFSDIHYGVTTKEKQLEKVIQEINRTNPDIVVFTGDLLDNAIHLSDKDIDFLKNNLVKIDSKFKKYAIMGDHDYSNEELFQNIMQNAGFQILNNQNELVFYEGNTPIQIIGISSIQKEDINLETIFQNKETNIASTILIAHEPATIDLLKNNQVDLMLCGHSFGGFIKLPFLGGILQKNNINGYIDGFYEINQTKLYVSSGIGTETYPFRFLNPPSINLYRIYNYN